jgi:hypothetical protein
MIIRQENQLKYITIHHDAIPHDNRFKTIKDWAIYLDSLHKKRTWAEAMKTKGEKGYRYLSYHYIVDHIGNHLHTQELKYERYHASDSRRGATSHNRWGIAICMRGYFHTPINNKPSEAQWKKVATLIYRLEKKLGRKLIIRGHNETSVTPTACPGSIIGTHRTAYLKRIIDFRNYLHINGEPALPPTLPKPPSCEELLRTRNNELIIANDRILKLEGDLKTERVAYNEREVEIEKLVNEAVHEKEQAQMDLRVAKDELKDYRELDLMSLIRLWLDRGQ